MAVLVSSTVMLKVQSKLESPIQSHEIHGGKIKFEFFVLNIQT